jgi:hypothetical protein
MLSERNVLNDRPRSRTWWLVAMAALAAVVFFAGRATAPGESGEPPAGDALPTPSSSLPPPPSSQSHPRTPEGAAGAATRFARVMSGATSDRAAFVRATEAIAAPPWRDEARRLAHNGVDFIVERYGPNGESMFVPVRYRILHFSRDEATIEVWGVTLAMGSSVPGIDESWVTGTLELAWIENRWLMAGGDSSVGPTPRLLQTGDPAPISYLEGFREYTRAPQP